ncbi:hypothetical protein [Calothrix sp. UHCC 0171]|uniref:hypothetical protein n=1 Tax=Calothrix sp. UHCC 0171 TaxID=3110245 RepID=UPI002B1F2F27|nr:hypothetical protein [Calothrix sp. UHCC 0171]MEA5570995.1 hypothetical protein [Calothrix sp. UHCC 0171]
MRLFNYPIYANASTQIVTTTTQENLLDNQLNVEVSPVVKMAETITSLSVCDYLGGLGIMLIFIAVVRIISQSMNPCKQSQSKSPQSKSQRQLDVEFLERVWIMNASKVED